jgi:pyruvate dehydrogenase E2 component (dihydrolipoamide acetyltransferase)
LILPLSLSWDHRALDGVAAARFLVALVQLLEDLRRLAL